MRIMIAASLGIIAVVALAIVALPFFGGSSGIGEPRPPIIREPEIVAANSPAASPPATNLQPSLMSTPSAPQTQPANPSANPANPPLAQPEHPAANPLQPNSLNPTGPGVTLPPLTQPSQPAAPQAQPAAPSTTPATAPEPRVTAQQMVTPSIAAAAAPTGLEAEFKSRKLTYNRPPEKLALDRPIDMSLIIDTTGKANAAERLQGATGTIVERDVDLSDIVMAELLGSREAFDIQLLSAAERQRLSTRVANEWRWRVTPKVKGTQTLTLNIYGFATGSLDAEPLDSYIDNITVEVQPVDELVTWARGYQPLFAVLAALAGIGSAMFAFLRFRDERKRNKASS